MHSLRTRIAKRINARMSRRGRVFDDQFFSRSLRNPTEVANAIAYVLDNSHRHDARRGWIASPTDEPDAFTSLALADSDPPLSHWPPPPLRSRGAPGQYLNSPLITMSPRP